MRRIVTFAFLGLLFIALSGCQSMPWNSLGKGQLDKEVGAPPSHFQTLSGRGTGVSDRAKEIEGRLGYQ